MPVKILKHDKAKKSKKSDRPPMFYMSRISQKACLKPSELSTHDHQYREKVDMKKTKDGRTLPCLVRKWTRLD
jgi:hypothetical protein